MGVPMIGCACAVCQSTDPRDNRSRPSILVRLAGGATILVDTSSDLRAQALRFKLTRIDAVLYTHSHADHILGLDELRRFNTLQGGPIPLYGDDRTLTDLRRIFSYAFHSVREAGHEYVPQLVPFVLDGPLCVAGADPRCGGHRLVEREVRRVRPLAQRVDDHHVQPLEQRPGRVRDRAAVGQVGEAPEAIAQDGCGA